MLKVVEKRRYHYKRTFETLHLGVVPLGLECHSTLKPCNLDLDLDSEAERYHRSLQYKVQYASIVLIYD
jgi:hypothetical protein